MKTTTLTMKIEAFAKVNFTLEVFAKRVDGYHALRSVVVPTSLSDTISLEEADAFSSDSGYPDDLCVRAARAMGEFAALRGKSAAGARIHVEKRIPAGGGLGGGSADAAAVIWALNEMWGLGAGPAELADVGARVGSDVPALVLSRACGPVVMEGRGEFVRPLFDAPTRPSPLRLHLVMANPGVFSSTPEVFSRSTPRVTNDAGILYNMQIALASGDLERIACATMNDLEAPATALHPEIAAAKSALAEAGALGAAMSGSGSTVFGLVPDEARGREIAALLGGKGLEAWTVAVDVP